MADQEAFDAYVAVHWTRLVRTASLLTGDPSSAEDLVQETLIRVAARWSRVERGAMDAYVRRVMYTRSVDAWRWRRRQPPPVDTVHWAPPSGEDVGTTVSTRVALSAALRQLTPRQRAVIVLRFYEDRTEVETASALGCSVSTVKSQTRDALARLRRLAPALADTFEYQETSHD